MKKKKRKTTTERTGGEMFTDRNKIHARAYKHTHTHTQTLPLW